MFPCLVGKVSPLVSGQSVCVGAEASRYGDWNEWQVPSGLGLWFPFITLSGRRQFYRQIASMVAHLEFPRPLASASRPGPLGLTADPRDMTSSTRRNNFVHFARF